MAGTLRISSPQTRGLISKTVSASGWVISQQLRYDAGTPVPRTQSEQNNKKNNSRRSCDSSMLQPEGGREKE